MVSRIPTSPLPINSRGADTLIDVGSSRYTRRWAMNPARTSHALMWVGAHPDDELFGAAACFARYSKQDNHAGVYVIATTGNTTYDAAGPVTMYGRGIERWEEGAASAAGVGATVRYLGLRDGKLAENEPVLTERITRIVREFRPDVVITHGPEGEYGHPDHIAVSRSVTTAIDSAADPSCYPALLGPCLDVWDTPKLYRIKYDRYPSSDPLTLTIPGDEHSDSLNSTYGTYAETLLRTSHASAERRWMFRKYPVARYTKLSLVRTGRGVCVSCPETTLTEGLPARSPLPHPRDWLICGPFNRHRGDMTVDYLMEEGGEAEVLAVAGARGGGRPWTAHHASHDYVNFRTLLAPDNYEAVAYAYGSNRSGLG